MRTSLPTDSAERKEYPIAEGCLDYFPAALAGVARHSKLGNDKHNPGEPLHWARGKSADHANCIARHLMDLAAFRAHVERGPGVSQEHIRALLDEADALVWRAAALSQELHEQFDNAPMPPRAWIDQKQPPVDNAHVAPGCEQFASAAMPDGMSDSHYCLIEPPMVRPGYSMECAECRKIIFAGT